MENQNNISWQAYEFKHYEKNYGWYVAMAATCLLVVGFFIIQKDIFAAISLGLIALLVVFFTRQKPLLLEIELNPKHIRYGNLVFPHKQIKHFWIVNNQRHRTLNFHTTALLNNIIILEIESEDPNEIRNFLIRFIPEHEETEETFPQKIMHHLKF